MRTSRPALPMRGHSRDRMAMMASGWGQPGPNHGAEERRQ